MMVAVLESSVSPGSFRAALVVALVLMTLGDCGGGGGAVDRRWKNKKGQYEPVYSRLSKKYKCAAKAPSVVKTQLCEDDSWYS